MAEGAWQDALYDHYKDSFSQIRQRETQRDRQFLLVIALFALLAVAISYSKALMGALGSVAIFGVSVDISEVPVPALLTLAWVYTLAMSLRYCQNSINVERQYEYLHLLEDRLGKAAGDDAVFQREGRAYLANYPVFSEWAWILYVFVLPALCVIASVLLVTYEWYVVDSSTWFKLADSLLAVGVTLNFFFYRGLSLLVGSFRALRSKLTSN
jgi:hypothetical protein